jgi:hypothetical protein
MWLNMARKQVLTTLLDNLYCLPELVKREKLALEYQLVEKEETIIMLTEKCKALEKGSASEVRSMY